ncbi:MAG: DUF6285 domain-containing protein [Pseudomonadota bacterium]
MLDHPRGPALLDAVARLLRDVLLPQLPAGSSAAFQARVAANAVDLAAREMRLGPTAEAEAADRLQALLQHSGAPDVQEAELALAIRSGAIDDQDPALRAHLWASTLDKLAIDQPSYAPYRRALQLRAASPQPPQE